MKPVYVIEISDRMVIDREIDKIKKEGNFTSDMISRYDLDEVSITKAIEELDTYQFLTSKKLVIAYNCRFLTGESVKILEEEIKIFEKYINNPNSDNCFVLVCNKLDERKKIVKLLNQKAVVIKPNIDLATYASNELKDYELLPGVLVLLLSYCNDDISKLASEIEKLKLYKLDTRTIMKEDVIALVEKEIDTSDNYVFSFVEAIVTKNKKQALTIYQDLRELNLDPIYILSMLANQFRIIHQAKLLEQEGMSKVDIAKHLDCKPYRIEKSLQNGKSYSSKKLINIILSLADLDLNIKSGKIESNLALEMFILGL